MYGPKIPIIFDPIVPIESPVCRKHVGYVSMDCKLMTKNVIASQNFTTITEHVLRYSNPVSEKFVQWMVCVGEWWWETIKRKV